MSLAIQLDLFRSPFECELEALRASHDKVRKGTYAKINALTTEVVDLKIRLEIMERNICKEKIEI